MQNIYLLRYGKTNFFKIGQTSQTIERRIAQIQSENKKVDSMLANYNLHSIATIQLELSKTQALLFESVLRTILEKNDCAIFGNDHFKTKLCQNEIVKLFYESIQKTFEILQSL